MWSCAVHRDQNLRLKWVDGGMAACCVWGANENVKSLSRLAYLGIVIIVIRTLNS